MKRAFRLCSVIALCIVVFTPMVFAGDPQAAYESLFGDEARRVASSANRNAPIEFAAKLLDSAKMLKTDPELRALLCTKAYAFGVKDPSGYATAIEAMQLLAETVPAKAPECDEKILAVYRQPFTRAKGDDRKQAGLILLDQIAGVASRLSAAHQYADAAKLYREAVSIATELQSDRLGELAGKLRNAQIAEKTERLKATLKASPGDREASRDLALLYIGEVDSPTEAAPFLEASGDPDLSAKAVLAAKRLDDLGEADAARLAEWYKELAANVSDSAKPALLARVRRYCQRFLSLHPAEDAARLKIVLLMNEAEKSLKSVRTRVSGPPTRYAEKKVLLIFSGNELNTAKAACETNGLDYDLADSFDSAKDDYSAYHSIICGSGKVDYWGSEEMRKSESFRHINKFIEQGGHLVVFGAWNGRNMEQLKRYGITTGANHCNYFAPVPRVTAIFFKGNEDIIPKENLMRSVGNFSCSAPHTVLLKRGAGPTVAESDPAMITLRWKKGRVTFTLVEPDYNCPDPGAAKENLWLITVTLSWIARDCPL